MTLFSPTESEARRPAWLAALREQLAAALPDGVIDVMGPDATPQAVAERAPQALVRRAHQTPGDLHTLQQEHDFTAVLWLAETDCAVLVHHPIPSSQRELKMLCEQLLRLFTATAIEQRRESAAYRTLHIRHRQLQRELEAVQTQLQTSLDESTHLWSQLRHSEQTYVDSLEREVARQTEQLQHTTLQLQKANDAKQQFLDNMSHELRTPMNGVIGMASLLSDTELTPEQHDYLAALQDASTNLLAIIDDILNFSNLESNPLKREHTPFNLHTLVEDVIDLHTAAAYRKDLEIAGLAHAATPQYVVGDSDSIRQILAILIGNAIKFTETGDILVRAACAAQTASEVLLQLDVTDTGIGIAPEYQSDLFTPFTQADGSSTRQHGGLGIGLAIANRLVTQLGGALEVFSELGQGSTFRVTLSLAKSDPPLAAGPEPIALTPMRLLVVDDHHANRIAASTCLASWGLEVDCASNGPNALDCLRQSILSDQPYTLVLLDHHMPDMNGLAVAQIVKADPTLAAIPLALMSPNPPSVDHARHFAAYLRKPLRAANLYACVQPFSPA